MGEQLGKALYFQFFVVLLVASGCFNSYRAGDNDKDDAGSGWGDVSRDTGVADVTHKLDSRIVDEDSGRRDSGRRDSGRRDSGRRDSGRRDSGRRDSGRWDSGRWDGGQDGCDSDPLDSMVPISVLGSTRSAPKRLEPSCAERGANERTFVFRPAISGRYQIDTFGSSFDTVLYILAGDCRGVERACDDDTNDNTQSYVSLWLNAGEMVTIVVDGFSTFEAGFFVLNIDRQNHECGNGIIEWNEQCDGRELGGASCNSLGFDRGILRCSPICVFDESMCVFEGTGGAGGTGGIGGTGGSGGRQCDAISLGTVVPQSASGSTYSRANLLEPSCAPWGSGEQTYLFQARRSGYYTFNTNGSNFDTVLYLLDGDCTATELVCNDDSDGLQSSVTVFLRAQQLVTVVVDGFDGDEGNFYLNTSSRENERVCGNGIIDPAEQCDGVNFGGLTCASYGYDIGSLYCDPIDCEISTSGCFDAPTAGISGSGGMASIGGYSGRGGDHCRSIALMSTIPQTTSGNTWNLPDSLNSGCVSNDGPDQSFTFTASQTRNYVFDTYGSSFDTVLYVRQGDCYGPEIACNDDSDGLQSRISVALRAGETVTIVVDGFDWSAGFFILNINRYENWTTCGDGEIQIGEQCDVNNLGGATCRSLGYQGGWLFCNLTNCMFNVSMCSDSPIGGRGGYAF